MRSKLLRLCIKTQCSAQALVRFSLYQIDLFGFCLTLDLGLGLVALLTLGVKHNAIFTKKGSGRSKSKHREDFNIFAKETCPDCEGEISRFEINGRRAFVCENCQPSPF